MKRPNVLQCGNRFTELKPEITNTVLYFVVGKCIRISINSSKKIEFTLIRVYSNKFEFTPIRVYSNSSLLQFEFIYLSCIYLKNVFRQTSREKFSKMRRDVLEKLELVDAKFQADFPLHTKKILELRRDHQKMISEALGMTTVFPIEADLDQKTFEYGKSTLAENGESEMENEIDPLATALEHSSLIDLN